MGANLSRCGNTAGKVLGDDRRLQRAKAHTHHGRSLRNGLDAVSQRDFLSQILAVGGNFNARDDQLTVALVLQFTGLPLHLPNGQGAHTASGIGYDAVGAEVHAAVLDFQHGTGASADGTCGQLLEYHTAEGVVHFLGGLLFQHRRLDGINEFVLIPCAENHVAADFQRVVGAQLTPAAADDGCRFGVLGR